MIQCRKHLSLIQVTLFMGCLSASFTSHAQALPAATQPQRSIPIKHVRLADHRDVQFALTFQTSGSNLDYAAPTSFFLVGGSLEISAEIYKGLGFAASGTGLHTQDSGQGIPVNFVAIVFGPRYNFHAHLGSHPLEIYGQGLVGEADGFDGLYPTLQGPLTSANSLAVQTGGGLDVGITKHIALRVINADWLRSTLPNGTTNVQNNLRLGAGIVLHSKPQ